MANENIDGNKLDKDELLEEKNKDDKKETTTLRIPRDTSDILNKVAQENNKSKEIIVPYIVDLWKEWGLLDKEYCFTPEKWLRDMANQIEKDLIVKLNMKKENLKMENQVNAGQLRVKEKALFKYGETLESPEKKNKFYGGLLGLMHKENPDVLEILKSDSFVSIDGRPKWYKIDNNGKPIVVLKEGEELVSCDNGWHIKGSILCDCNRVRMCNLRLSENREYANKNKLPFKK